MFQKMKSRKGFTLIEMLVVIAIIAVLVAIVVPTVTAATGKAAAAANAANLRSVASQVAILTAQGEDATGTLTGTANGTLTVGTKSIEAPVAKAVSDLNVTKGTVMTVKIQENNIVATYGEVTISDFADYAETGEAD